MNICVVSLTKTGKLQNTHKNEDDDDKRHKDGRTTKWPGSVISKNE